MTESAARHYALWFPLARPQMPQELVDETAWGILRLRAETLPIDIMGAIEVRLGDSVGDGDSARDVDLSVRLENPAQALAVARELSAHRRSFVENWAIQEARRREIEAIWLEFDRATGSPVFCVRVTEKKFARDAEALVSELLPEIHGRPLGRTQADLVRRAMANLPPEGRVLYAFSLDPRPGQAVRLEFCDFGPQAMAEYLSRTVSAEAAARVASLEPLIRGADRYHLSLDFFEQGISPRIGVELGFQRLPHREPGWREVADRLVGAELCTPEKRDALFLWPGWETARDAGDRWPTSIKRGYCIRALSHFKLVTTPDSLEAKAYLLLQYLERRRAAS